MSYHDKNIPSGSSQSKTNAQGQTAPEGYHYMPDGTLMADSDMPSYLPEESQVCTESKLKISNTPSKGTILPGMHWWKIVGIILIFNSVLSCKISPHQTL